MNRLQSELQRLFAPPGEAGQTRALVLELARPADWAALAAVWRGVQQDLALPAPAIAVSGTEGFQLWFSLETPVPVASARLFLEGLRHRYLPQIAAERLGLTPVADSRQVPAAQGTQGNWSAFVAADLAPVFADTPWLDVQPGDEGQADLLSGLAPIKPAAFDAACAQLRPAEPSGPVQPARDEQERAGAARESTDDPARFLLQLMNDDSVALALRVDAAKALLPYRRQLRRRP